MVSYKTLYTSMVNKIDEMDNKLYSRNIQLEKRMRDKVRTSGLHLSRKDEYYMKLWGREYHDNQKRMTVLLNIRKVGEIKLPKEKKIRKISTVQPLMFCHTCNRWVKRSNFNENKNTCKYCTGENKK